MNTTKKATGPFGPDVVETQLGIEGDDIEAALPSMVYVNDRIFEYGRKLDRWKELDSQSVTMDLNSQAKNLPITPATITSNTTLHRHFDRNRMG